MPLLYHVSLFSSTRSFFFFFNDTATTEIYTLSLHTLFRSAIVEIAEAHQTDLMPGYTHLQRAQPVTFAHWLLDRKSTRLNSSHSQISYAVFCLKKKR